MRSIADSATLTKMQELCGYVVLLSILIFSWTTQVSWVEFSIRWKSSRQVLSSSKMFDLEAKSKSMLENAY